MDTRAGEASVEAMALVEAEASVTEGVLTVGMQAVAVDWEAAVRKVAVVGVYGVLAVMALVMEVETAVAVVVVARVAAMTVGGVARVVVVVVVAGAGEVAGVATKVAVDWVVVAKVAADLAVEAVC